MAVLPDISEIALFWQAILTCELILFVYWCVSNFAIYVPTLEELVRDDDSDDDW